VANGHDQREDSDFGSLLRPGRTLGGPAVGDSVPGPALLLPSRFSRVWNAPPLRAESQPARVPRHKHGPLATKAPRPSPKGGEGRAASKLILLQPPKNMPPVDEADSDSDGRRLGQPNLKCTGTGTQAGTFLGPGPLRGSLRLVTGGHCSLRLLSP
jgi:hypothetical protein